MRLSLIVALDKNGLIGRDNHLPWCLPADLRHFKQITMGKPVLMGRRTCESLKGSLPGRRNLVLTRNSDFRREGFEVFHTVESVLENLQPSDEAIVIGGADLYRLFLDQARRAYVTLVNGEFQGDTWFPHWPLPADWRLVDEVKQPADSHNPHDMTFMVFEKVEIF